jgi:hypothetical protein
MPAGEQLQYGWLLLKIRDNDRLYSVVSELSASQGLSNEQQTELRRLWSSWSIQRANDMFAAGDQRRSLAILQAAAQSFPKDRNVENALAGAYLRASEAKPALAIYLTLDMSQATVAEYEGAIGAAIAARDKKRAAAWLQIGLDRYHDDPIILKMAAQLEQSRGHNTRAAEYYKAALSVMGPPAGTAEEARFTPDQRLMELLVPGARSMSSAFSGVEIPQRPGNSGTAPVTERQQIEDQLAVIQGASSSWVGGESGVSYRSGQPGYDRLAIYSAGMEGSNMIAPGVRTTVITRPVILESGQPTSAATFQQGTLPAGTLRGSQPASGLGGEIQVSTSSFGAALGYSPHGFLVENVIGRLSIHPQLAHFTLDFSRAPILDTQLSYAGLRDLGSRSSTSPGNIWGGVLANSGELHLTFGDRQHLPMHLDYRYNTISLAKSSSLRVSANGSLVRELPLPHDDKPKKALSYDAQVPLVSMRPFANTFLFTFYFQLAKTGACQDTPPIDLQGGILRSSYLDLRGLKHWAAMPNLELFANAGFPFTRFADLSQTTIVLPSQASPEEIGLYLSLLAYFSEQTGYPALRVHVTDSLRDGEDSDELILGTPNDQAAFAALNAVLPVHIKENGFSIANTEGFFSTVENAWWQVAEMRPNWWRRLNAPREQKGVLDSISQFPDALIQGVAAPWSKDRSVVTITLKDKEAADTFAAAFWQSSMSGDIGQSVSVLHGSDFSSYRLGSSFYHVGDLPLWSRVRYSLRTFPWLIVLLTFVLGLFVVPWTRMRLDNRVRERLEGHQV